MKRTPAESMTRPTSLKDRALIFLEYQGNRRLRRLGTFLYRLTKGRITPSNRDVLLLTTRGRTSGRDHTILIQGFREGKNLVVVAANSGRSVDPDWYRNLDAAPNATVELKGQSFQVRAEHMTAEECATLWPHILERAPTYERFLRTTTRTIPLVRLVPIDDTVERAL